METQALVQLTGPESGSVVPPPSPGAGSVGGVGAEVDGMAAGGSKPTPSKSVRDDIGAESFDTNGPTQPQACLAFRQRRASPSSAARNAAIRKVRPSLGQKRRKPPKKRCRAERRSTSSSGPPIRRRGNTQGKPNRGTPIWPPVTTRRAKDPRKFRRRQREPGHPLV